MKLAPIISLGLSVLLGAAALLIWRSDIYGLTTLQVDTTVELRDGQAFAIAGLLQDRTSEEAVKTPFLSDIPVLGALFSSGRYQREETELVIIVTPRLVKPMASLDDIDTPNEREFFLGNKLSFAPHNQWTTFG